MTAPGAVPTPAERRAVLEVVGFAAAVFEAMSAADVARITGGDEAYRVQAERAVTSAALQSAAEIWETGAEVMQAIHDAMRVGGLEPPPLPDPPAEAWADE